ncbi:uncharacterized protein TNCT_208221 [Trichonephila clavata]|uniref:Gustatory receptor n=1 Tax=Trichonephila clavata TaxID=2740835 RepID=A0A8X6GHV7_TRICU|nr:uncharacterized protein TNCT_208221 [Trichonephila clavata]
MILFIICTLPFLTAALFTYLAYKEDQTAIFWTLGFEVKNDIYVTIIRFIGSYIHYTVYQAYPCLFALSICLLIHRYGLILLQINDTMNKQILENSAFFAQVVSRYNTLEKELHILRDTLSKPLFFVLLSCFCSLFTTIAAYLEYRIIPPMFLVELGSNALTSLIIVVFVAHFVSRIPEYMWKIKTEAGFLMDEYQCRHRKRSGEMDLLEIIRRKEILYLSAGGVYFKKSFLLTAFGTFFTYGLLIATTK